MNALKKTIVLSCCLMLFVSFFSLKSATANEANLGNTKLYSKNIQMEKKDIENRLFAVAKRVWRSSCKRAAEFAAYEVASYLMGGGNFKEEKGYKLSSL